MKPSTRGEGDPGSEPVVDLASETNEVHRHGSVVVRNAGPHSETVHALLRHLADAGFGGSPKVVGDGFDPAGRETISFVQGDVLHPGLPTVEGTAALGVLLRDLHEATSSFVPGHHAVWQPWFGRSLGEGERVVGHCDAAPWNVVTRDGLPVALIDWELAGPVDPLVDLAQAAWLNARLYSDDIAEREGLPPVAERARQLRAIVDGYRLDEARRAGFVDLMIEFAIHSTAADADEDGVTRDTVRSRALWGMAWRSRSAAWMLRNRKVLERALA